ncbi:bifunctional riboflavin kinase/FAD synthetase [Rubripirellula amarantea]|nr:bifunctional riboflavin kinase/FAD synthetase [Rubripirellula amarantea]
MTQLVFLDDIGSAELATACDPGDALAKLQGGAIAIGNFDGVHRGHAVLLKRLHQMARNLGGPSVAVTFDPHPARILRPELAPLRLTWMELRAERMTPLGIDFLLVCRTTPELLQLSAEDFFQRLVVDRLAARAMVEGPNFFFGRDRGGDIKALKQLTDQHSIELSIVSAESQSGKMVSSSSIRNHLSRGEVKAVIQVCEVPHRIRGLVATGAGRGREIGFPTANLTQIDVAVPAAGVYAGYAWVDGAKFPAAVHLGPNPTFGDNQKVKVEVHLLDYHGDLYKKALMVDFIDRVRNVKKFDSAEQLIDQLQQDMETVRAILAS